MTNPRTIKLVVGVTMTFAALVMAEVVVRSTRIPPNTPVVHRIPHPSLGWRLEPNARMLYATSEFRVPVVYNSKGWRDVERTYAKPEGTFRVVVLGDSFMEAYSVPLEQSFAHQLESELIERTGQSVEVINLGVGGYGTLQQYLAFVEEGIRYEPDAVVLGFFTNNDVSDNSLAIQHALRRGGSVKLQSRPFLDPSAEWKISPPDFAAAQDAFKKARANISGPAPVRVMKETALYQLMRDARRHYQLKDQAKPASDVDVKEDDGFNQKMDVYLCNEPPEYVEAWRLTDRIFARLAAAVRASGAELMVFSVPSVPEVMTSGRSDRFCLAQPPSSTRLSPILASHRIPYVDLVGDFRRQHEAGAYLFWKSDGHWTHDGHSVAARRVAEQMSQHHLLRARAAATSTSAMRFAAKVQSNRAACARPASRRSRA